MPQPLAACSFHPQSLTSMERTSMSQASWSSRLSSSIQPWHTHPFSNNLSIVLSWSSCNRRVIRSNNSWSKKTALVQVNNNIYSRWPLTNSNSQWPPSRETWHWMHWSNQALSTSHSLAPWYNVKVRILTTLSRTTSFACLFLATSSPRIPYLHSSI